LGARRHRPFTTKRKGWSVRTALVKLSFNRDGAAADLDRLQFDTPPAGLESTESTIQDAGTLAVKEKHSPACELTSMVAVPRMEAPPASICVPQSAVN
jgi:hypothetical protein